MMMDDLEFEFEDRDRRRHRRRQGPARGQGDDAYSGQQYPGYSYQDGQYPGNYQDNGYGQQYPQQPYPGQGYGQNPYGQGYPPNDVYPDYGYDDQGYVGYDTQGNYGGTTYGGGATYGGRGASGSGHSRGAGKKKKKKKGKARGKSKGKLWAILGTVLVLCLGGGGYFGYDKIAPIFFTQDFEGEGSGEAIVEIAAGDSGMTIARKLVQAGVIKSQDAFLKASIKDPDQANRIQPGKYKLRKEMSAVAAIALLLNPSSRLVSGITIPEGLSTFKIYKLLAEKLKLPEIDFVEAAKDPLALGVPAAWYARKDGKPVSQSIEGFLFPDTYEFPPKATAKEVLTIMVKRFLEVTKSIKMMEKFANDPKVSPYQALIVASLAQAEAGNADDLGKVARVAYNRIYKRIAELACACLQFDVTVIYSREMAGLPPKGSAELSSRELEDPKNPYNRKAIGLPPTPINNPGKAALLAATEPPEGNWYYFVAIDKQGHSAFSSTHAQFCRDNETAVANGVLPASSCG